VNGFNSLGVSLPQWRDMYSKGGFGSACECSSTCGELRLQALLFVSTFLIPSCVHSRPPCLWQQWRIRLRIIIPDQLEVIMIHLVVVHMMSHSVCTTSTMMTPRLSSRTPVVSQQEIRQEQIHWQDQPRRNPWWLTIVNTMSHPPCWRHLTDFQRLPFTTVPYPIPPIS